MLKIDRLLAYGLIILSIPILILSINKYKASFFMLAFFTICFSFIWLLLRERFINYNLYDSQKEIIMNKRKQIVCKILFFVFLSCCILSLYYRKELYSRPTLFFILVAILVILVLLQILNKNRSRFETVYILIQIIIIGFILGFSQQILFIDVIETDPWVHKTITEGIIYSSFIPENTTYSKLPIFHLIISIFSIIADINYKYSSILSIALMQIICNVLFIYLIANVLFSKEKIGLLSSLLLITAENQIWMNYVIIPNSLAGIYMLIILFLLTCNLKRKNVKINILYLVFMFVLILTHTISSVAMLIILIAYFVGSFIIYKDNKIKINVVLFFLVTLFAWWTYASGHITYLGELIKWGFSIDYYVSSVPKDVLNYNVPILESLYNSLGSILFYTASIIGILYIISNTTKYKKGLIFITAGIVLSIITFSSFFGFWIMQYRWFYFVQIFLCIPLSISIVLIYYNIKLNMKIKRFCLCFCIACLTFVTITNVTSNLDYNVFSKMSNIRLAQTQSEFSAVNFIKQKELTNIGTDEYYNIVIREYAKQNSINLTSSDISHNLFYNSYEDIDALVLIRKAIETEPLRIFRQKYKLNYDPVVALEKIGFARIYDNNSVRGLLPLVKAN